MPLLAFLPRLWHTPFKQSKPPQLEPSQLDTYVVHRAPHVPLATWPPPKILALPDPPSHVTIEELRVKKANDDLRNVVMQSFKTLTEQLEMAITSRPLAQPIPLALEACNYGTNIWCHNCNKHGHNYEFFMGFGFIGHLVTLPPGLQQNHF